MAAKTRLYKHHCLPIHLPPSYSILLTACNMSSHRKIHHTDGNFFSAMQNTQQLLLNYIFKSLYSKLYASIEYFDTLCCICSKSFQGDSGLGWFCLYPLYCLFWHRYLLHVMNYFFFPAFQPCKHLVSWPLHLHHLDQCARASVEWCQHRRMVA